MAKRTKQPLASRLSASRPGNSVPGVPAVGTRQDAIHPPAKHPTMLAVSVALFALWFAFLLVTALLG